LAVANRNILEEQPNINLTQSVDAAPNRRILVVDDNSDVRNLYKHHLEKLGYNILMAESGEQAVALYSDSIRKKLAIEVVITDLNLPGMDGQGVARKIRELDPRARLIVSSGDSAAPEMRQSGSFLFDGVMEKYFDRATMQLVLEKVITEK